ncbi:Adenylylsulfatase HINT1 isoform C [Glycine soja]|uniref:Adenylylsulfatase HINT1 isoform C n=1 Tax=Glycine soja TaxID=3848 RepID=A0A445FFH7_GLYSO|nr:Adenylylsulfatase HINT1 isoform C [Glycine soja]
MVPPCLEGSKILLACFRHSGNAISHGHRNRRVSLWVSFAGDSVKIYARFDKIINKEIPSTVVYEDDKVLAFRDIDPQAPTHILIIPKVRDGLTGLSKAEERHCEILGRLLCTAKLVAKQEGLDDGFRIVINDGRDGGQSVYHIHVHLIGGRQMGWPPF